jgi:hypothetical protein
MDLNLTGELWGMPFSLIGQAAEICDISTLPANITIVNQMAATNTWIIAAIGALGAIFGALSGGLANYMIERRKRQFDLKKQIYFEAVEFFSAIALFEHEENLDLDRAGEMTEVEYHNEYRPTREAVWERWSTDNKVIDKLILLKYKLELCGAPMEVLENINTLKDYLSENDPSRMHKLIIEELIPALRKDISKENSWKLWE